MADMRKYSLSKMQERPATPVDIRVPELQQYTDIKYYYYIDHELKLRYLKKGMIMQFFLYKDFLEDA